MNDVQSNKIRIIDWNKWEDYVVRINNLTRARLDWSIREAMYSDSDLVNLPFGLPEKFYDYWYWYARLAGKQTSIDYYWKPKWTEYKSKKASMLAYSGGVESIIGKRILYGTDIVYFTDTEAKDGILPYKGMIEGCIAIIGAALGYANTVVGIEEYSNSTQVDRLYEGRDPQNVCTDPLSIEQTDEWLHRWCIYAAPAAVQSIVCVWHKDELYRKVVEKGEVLNLQSCSNYTPEKPFCANCYKCFSLWVMDEIMGLKKLPFKISREAYLKYYAEYKEFLKTGVDKMVSLNLYARIEEFYGVYISDLMYLLE